MLYDSPRKTKWDHICRSFELGLMRKDAHRSCALVNPALDNRSPSARQLEFRTPSRERAIRMAHWVFIACAPEPFKASAFVNLAATPTCFVVKI